ncbi:MAG: peptidoglycan/LPS O-acetylase OafA/YrhL [Halioglobus sp.]
MKSSTGKYFVGLDHIRAIAAFMVFCWHFIQVVDGHRGDPSIFPFAILTEGHTGVALFMTLSGYLFAKLLDGKHINYRSFLWNRFLRLAPLLILVVFLVGAKHVWDGGKLGVYLNYLKPALIKPVLPNGGWSITVEFHFYLILPILLFLSGKSRYLLFALLGLALLIRVILYEEIGQIHFLSYWTIVGRIDQFLFGILAFYFRDIIRNRHALALLVFLGFSAFYYYFDSTGGYYSHFPLNSPSSLWLIIPTVEGFAYAWLIAWYDNSFEHSQGRFSRFLALVGTYSYSIYLLHVFMVWKAGDFINEYMFTIPNVYVALLVAPFVFLTIMPVAWFSYQYIELPFLKFRTKYIIDKKELNKT